jgi:hypothetical protein
MKSFIWTAVALANFGAATLNHNPSAWLNVAAGFLALAASFFCRKAN